MSDAGSTWPALQAVAPASFLQTSHVTQASITTTPHAPLRTPAHPYGSYRCHPYDSGRQSLLSSLGFQAAGPADLPAARESEHRAPTCHSVTCSSRIRPTETARESGANIGRSQELIKVWVCNYTCGCGI
ncbi:hypothetical protein Bbelb_134560 [Branchiostoma belcheri]|nr:hypothetical protein Bbelb_134560 [Branchiostoma belcheri]